VITRRGIISYPFLYLWTRRFFTANLMDVSVIASVIHGSFAAGLSARLESWAGTRRLGLTEESWQRAPDLGPSRSVSVPNDRTDPSTLVCRTTRPRLRVS
jgi:hypothetical protein